MTVIDPVRQPTHFVLDTDIGSDVDDLLALGVALGSPELALTAVTTVYGDVALRARMVSRALSTAGRSGPKVVPGRAKPLSGREVWWPGHEGKLMPALESEVIDDDLDAIDILAGNMTIAAMGPMTNLAEAVTTGTHRIRRIVAMGGAFDDTVAEHNITCDVPAAAMVFASGVPMSVVGLDQTTRVRFGWPFHERIITAGAFGALLATEIRQFWQFVADDSNCPHDAVAILSMIRPDLFRFETGHLTVTTSGPATGQTSFSPDPRGPHRIVTDLDVDRVVAEIETRILSAAVPDPPARTR